MTTGDMATWATAIIALILGLRAEYRALCARREKRSEKQAVAFSELMTLLEKAKETLPGSPTENVQNYFSDGKEALVQLRENSRRIVGIIAEAFPAAAGDILELSENLARLCEKADSETTNENDSKQTINILKATYQNLRLLSIPTSTRILLKRKMVTYDTIHNDPYYKEFNVRYQRFRQEVLKLIWK